MDRAVLISTLQLFNEKAERLNKLTIGNLLASNGTYSVAIRRFQNPQDPWALTVEKGYPGDEPMQAFVLTFRFFIQDNEPISFRKMAALYEDPAIAAAYRAEFALARTWLNYYLDSRSELDALFRMYLGQSRTHREVMDIIIYGGLSHAKQAKKAIYDSWMTVPAMAAMVEFQFIGILTQVLKIIKFVKELNEQVLQDLQMNNG